MKASECKCCECGKQAVAFWPAFDPDIPSHPYCRECLDKVKEETLLKLLEIDEKYNKKRKKKTTIASQEDAKKNKAITKVEQYIQDYTRNCSNEVEHFAFNPCEFHPWLTPDHAFDVARISREETIEDTIDWMEHNLCIGPHFDLVANNLREALLNEEDDDTVVLPPHD